ncbi:MAG TPA: hypothetical protein VJT50_04630 [Pyrinomonadaceae bacterium]|nr:hypothetical protein [Pyrinomonadaceae bacterium]
MKQRTNKVGFQYLLVTLLTLVAAAILTATPRISVGTSAQRHSRIVKTSHSERANTAAREMVDVASELVCKERITDPKGSVPIDDMQSRPSLPVDSPAAVSGAERAQRLLPAAQRLVLAALEQLSREYKLRGRRGYELRLQRAIARVEAVQNVRPDVDSRDNASVLMKNPRTIIFGTIFLAGLPSDEGVISVLSHELVHIADGSQDNLTLLFRTVALRASAATGLRIRDQRAEELACDLVGAMATRAYVAETPTYETLPQRISRALEHNCVETDEGDEDHLSPRDTIRAILFLKPSFSRELVYGR